MIYYKCEDCGAIFDEFEKIDGYTIREDEYINDQCPECFSDEIYETDIEEETEAA